MVTVAEQVEQRIFTPPDSGLPVFGLMTLLDMLEKYSFSFCEVTIKLEKLRNEASAHSHLGPYGGPTKMPDYTRKELLESLAEMRLECENLGLTNTADLASFIHFEVCSKDDSYTYTDLAKDLNTFKFSFFNELRKRFFFGIADDKKDYIQKDDLFGPEVSAAFPSSVPEIKSAGNCFALEERDACVFHLMRTLEHPLRALANDLGVPPPVKNPQTTLELRTWGDVIDQIIIAINKRPNPKTPAEAELSEFYNRAAEQFQFFKDAWRDVVMHARNKHYLEGETKDLIRSVESFIKRLATRLKE
jgi:hypothetical protein